jgi:hypothetical protein
MPQRIQQRSQTADFALAGGGTHRAPVQKKAERGGPEKRGSNKAKTPKGIILGPQKRPLVYNFGLRKTP